MHTLQTFVLNKGYTAIICSLRNEKSALQTFVIEKCRHYKLFVVSKMKKAHPTNICKRKMHTLQIFVMKKQTLQTFVMKTAYTANFPVTTKF